MEVLKSGTGPGFPIEILQTLHIQICYIVKLNCGMA